MRPGGQLRGLGERRTDRSQGEVEISTGGRAELNESEERNAGLERGRGGYVEKDGEGESLN
jgi:hypothetical protein